MYTYAGDEGRQSASASASASAERVSSGGGGSRRRADEGDAGYSSPDDFGLHNSIVHAGRYTKEALEAVGLGLSPNLRGGPDGNDGDGGGGEFSPVGTPAGRGGGTSPSAGASANTGAGGRSSSTMEGAAGTHRKEEGEPWRPSDILSVKVLRAWGLAETLGGTNAYVVFDWGRYGKAATQAVANTTQPHFGATLQFRSPYKAVDPQDSAAALLGVRRGSSNVCRGGTDASAKAGGGYDRFDDGCIEGEGEGGEGAGSMGAVVRGRNGVEYLSLAGPLKVLVYSRNPSVSDELIALGEVDAHDTLLSCARTGGAPVVLHLFDTQQNPAGCVEFTMWHALFYQ
jgi:hypothetical protein